MAVITPTEERATHGKEKRKASGGGNNRRRDVSAAIAALERLSDADMARAIKTALLGPLHRNSPTRGVYLAIELLLDKLLRVPEELPERVRDGRDAIVSRLAATAQGNFRSNQDDAASLRRLGMLIWESDHLGVPLQYKAEGIVNDIDKWRDDVARRRTPAMDVDDVLRALKKPKLHLRVAHVALAAGIVPGDVGLAIRKATGALKHSPW